MAMDDQAAQCLRDSILDTGHESLLAVRHSPALGLDSK